MTRASEPLLARLQAHLGYVFVDPHRLHEALAHSSLIGDGIARTCNERLEFLGDRVLGLAVADLLFRTFPHEHEGLLARRHAALVSRPTLAEVAGAIDLAPCLRLSRGEQDAGGRNNPGLLANACEAVIGAIHLDGGFEAARNVVIRLWEPLVARYETPPKDAKTLLQEWAQQNGRALPRYRETDRAGPPHAPTFCIEVSVDGLEPATATGSSKRGAERAAAETMLTRVGLWNDA